MASVEKRTIVRRNRPGTKASDFYSWAAQDFNDMDTILAGQYRSMISDLVFRVSIGSYLWLYNFQISNPSFPPSVPVVQQYIQYMIRKDHTNVDAILEPPEGHDDLAVWKYEHLRQFCLELNGMAVRLQNECNPKICKQMTASEQWIFLCAAHGEPKECSALDYTLHTLHGASSLLNSNKHFDSRVSIKESSVQRLGSIARRIYRIFSHAFFHHRQLFDDFESGTTLCLRFTRFVTKYSLMSPENLLVQIDRTPAPEADQEEEEEEEEEEESEA